MCRNLAGPAAKRLKIRFTALSQFRPLAKLKTKTDMDGALEHTARKCPLDDRGGREPTAEIFAQAVHEYTSDSDDLAREQDRKKEAARLRAAHQRQGIPVNEPEPAADPDPPETPFFPRVETINQACTYLRSWVLAMTRRFAPEELAVLDEELYGQCSVLRQIYQPAIQAAAEAKKHAARRAK